MPHLPDTRLRSRPQVLQCLPALPREPFRAALPVAVACRFCCFGSAVAVLAVCVRRSWETCLTYCLTLLPSHTRRVPGLRFPFCRPTCCRRLVFRLLVTVPQDARCHTGSVALPFVTLPHPMPPLNTHLVLPYGLAPLTTGLPHTPYPCLRTNHYLQRYITCGWCVTSCCVAVALPAGLDNERRPWFRYAPSLPDLVKRYATVSNTSS